MQRRRLLAASGTALGLALAGCSGGDPDDESGDESDDASATGGGAGTPGRIDPIGHALGEDAPFYSFGHVADDGERGVLGSFPSAGSTVASTLFDLGDLEDPTEVHRLDAATPSTRTNDVRFDALRDGLYYRTQETHDDDGLEGIEVVDFGWAEGTPEEPEVVARLETPNTGVHKLTSHPDEPILYLVDTRAVTDVGVLTVDVSEPDDPELVDAVGPTGGCHHLSYDPDRDVLHAAYVQGPAEGYVVYDLEDPRHPTVLAEFPYEDLPDYEAIGEPGFEGCHGAEPDPERDLVVLGDESLTGVPGGKHVLDVGWDEGSLESPEPIGFTHAPDAREMDEETELWWTTHFHDVVRLGDETFMVDGGYRQGVWVCNLTDPRDPVPTERYATVDGAERAPDHSADTPGPATPPFAWNAVYNETRDFVFASDSVTGAYTFDLSAEPARGDDGGGPDGHYDLDSVLLDGDEEE